MVGILNWPQPSPQQKNQCDLLFHYQVSNQLGRLKGTKISKREQKLVKDSLKTEFSSLKQLLAFLFPNENENRACINETISRLPNTTSVSVPVA